MNFLPRTSKCFKVEACLMMKQDQDDPWRVVIVLLVLITGRTVSGDFLGTDREVLLDIKAFLEERNQVNKGHYSNWNLQDSSPCNWIGIQCTPDGSRVNGINFSENGLSGELYHNFSALSALTHLDLSFNTFIGSIPDDLSSCSSLVYLNLSHNTLSDELRLTSLSNLEILDLSTNRLFGGFQFSFPAICSKLVAANLSMNNFSGSLGSSFDECFNLQHLDLSTNQLNGRIWNGFPRLQVFSVSENFLNGELPGSYFDGNCKLQNLDLSENNFSGPFPGEISNCKNLSTLNVCGNNFTGLIPNEMGAISSLQVLNLGNNSFNRAIPDSLLNLSNLVYLELSRNYFRGDVQDIFGRFTQVKFLVLHGNFFSGGLYSSGILKLQNLVRLDLSYNNFSGPLPTDISQLNNLKFLVLAHNQFNGSIPREYGNMKSLQALDLSFNSLTDQIPPSLGNLTSLLWLMLANNKLTGGIPPELGNCSSLLWLNLANNQLSGNVPSELMNIGRYSAATFNLNQRNEDVTVGSGECLVMKRWIPADYPPFSFVYSILTRKTCRSIWDRLLKGYGLFPMCARGSNMMTYQISGYLQLSGNLLSGEITEDIGKLQNFSMVHLGYNGFHGNLPSQIGNLQLVVLNLTQNKLTGEIPATLGSIRCLENLDLSSNNFSGKFPSSLNELYQLNKFNISYNPLISGTIPSTGQLATFEKNSFLGDPLLELPEFISGNQSSNGKRGEHAGEHSRWAAFSVFLALLLALIATGAVSITICLLVRTPKESACLLEDTKCSHELATTSSSSSSPWLSDTVKVIHLDKRAFTHSDILKATGHFSDARIIGKGGFGTVYQGMLPNGREVAVKKLQREGIEGEKEFRAEMEVLSGNSLGWPHQNLVTLYGWCLDGSDKILVYEYMEGGSLEDLIHDTMRLNWRRRIDVSIDVARALVFLHHECYPAIVHRDVKASNVLLDRDGTAKVTDFGLARFVEAGDSHVTTMVAGTVGYVAPEYGQTWQATTKGDVYSFGVLAMELATGRRAVDGGEECLVEWARRVVGLAQKGTGRAPIPVALLGSGLAEDSEEMLDLLRIGITCTSEAPQARPNMKEVLAMLIRISSEQT